LLWRAAGLGKGYASVAIAGERIFTLGDRGEKEFVIALPRSGGKEVWSAEIGKAWPDGGARCTPTVDGERVYALSPHGDLVCVAADTGKELWRKSLPGDFGGKMMSGWGYCESPLVDGDKLICTPGGKEAALVALDKKTGQALWKCALPDLGPAGTDGAGYSSIVISEAGGIRQYVQLLGHGVVGVAAEDGRFLWGYNKVANGTANIPTPIVHDDLIFCTTAYDAGSALLKLTPTPDKGIAAQEVYFMAAKDFQNHHGGVVLVDGYLYGGHGQNAGQPTCIELKTGKIMWKEAAPGGGSAAALYADGHVYFRYEDGTMALIEATPAALKVAGMFKLPTNDGPSWPHPVIADGKLYLRYNDTLLCYGLTPN
jgi:prepilin-type processing-associated H-X9-DG protein